MPEVEPIEIQYTSSLPVVSQETTNTNQISLPTNGSVFNTLGAQIIVDLPSQGFLDPTSLMCRYKATYTGAAALNGVLVGCPAVSPFSKLEVIYGSSSEVLQGYNQIYTQLFTNLSMTNTQKMAWQAQMGWGDPVSFAGLLNGRVITFPTTPFTITPSSFYAFPLVCSLSNAKQPVPLCKMSGPRLIFTLASSLAEIQGPTPGISLATTNGLSISNFEVSYNIIRYSASITNRILSDPTPIKIKTLTYSNTGVSIPAGTSGVQDYTFSVKASSMKALFFLFCGSGATQLNGIYDAVDITSGGQLSVYVNGVQYPSRVIDVGQQKASVLENTRKAISTIGGMYSDIFDRGNEMSISASEFVHTEATATATATPAKTIFGISLESLHKNGEVYSGISPNNTPISLRVSYASATTLTHNAQCIVALDGAICIDAIGLSSLAT